MLPRYKTSETELSFLNPTSELQEEKSTLLQAMTVQDHGFKNSMDEGIEWGNSEKESSTDNPKAVYYANVRFLGKK